MRMDILSNVAEEDMKRGKVIAHADVLKSGKVINYGECLAAWRTQYEDGKPNRCAKCSQIDH